MEISELIEKRNAARAAKQWAIADNLRNEAVRLGYRLADTKTGTVAVPIEYDYMRFPSFEFLLDNFYLSYVEDGQRCSICIAPHAKLPGFEKRLIVAIAQQTPEIKERLEKLLRPERQSSL